MMRLILILNVLLLVSCQSMNKRFQATMMEQCESENEGQIWVCHPEDFQIPQEEAQK